MLIEYFFSTLSFQLKKSYNTFNMTLYTGTVISTIIPLHPLSQVCVLVLINPLTECLHTCVCQCFVALLSIKAKQQLIIHSGGGGSSKWALHQIVQRPCADETASVYSYWDTIFSSPVFHKVHSHPQFVLFALKPDLHENSPCFCTYFKFLIVQL